MNRKEVSYNGGSNMSFGNTVSDFCQGNTDCCFLKDGLDSVVGCGWDDFV